MFKYTYICSFLLNKIGEKSKENVYWNNAHLCMSFYTF